MSQRRARHTGFTLMEVILAVALSAVVVYVVAAGIDFHLRQLTLRKSRIQQAQLARAILSRIAHDLRATIVDRPTDLSSIAQIQSLASAASSEDASAEGDSDEQTGESDASEIIASAAVPTTPGLYGTAQELQIDVGRIPRYEEYAMLSNTDVAQSATATMLSDVKTISYFLLGANRGGTANSLNSATMSNESFDTLGLPPDQPLQGLGRRVIDRSAARFAGESGSFSYVDQQIELIAPEVMWIEFHYFDGTQWLAEWHTEQLEGVPLAVEILLVLKTDSDEIDEVSAGLTASASSLRDLNADQVYRLVVHLPASDILPGDEPPTDASFEDEGGEQ